MRYFVAIPIPEPGRSRLLGIKAQFRPAGWRDTMDPHITILAPGRPAQDPDEASKTFASSGLEVPSFHIFAHRLQRFTRHRRHTLVLAPDNPDALTNLFIAVLAKCKWQETSASTRRQYQPHITLVNQVSDAQLAVIENQLSALDPGVEFNCQTLTLYAKQTKWPSWQPLQSLSLLDR